MKTITWLGVREAKAEAQKNPEAYVISIGCKYGTDHDVISSARKQFKHCFPVAFGLDQMAAFEWEGLGEFLLSIPEDADLIVHCNEGRYRSRYTVEAIQMAWAWTMDDVISLAKVRGIGGQISSEDTWGIVRPTAEKIAKLLEVAKHGKEQSTETEGSEGAQSLPSPEV